MDRNEILRFMRRAIDEAEEAQRMNEVPVGCVIVRDHTVIAKGPPQPDAYSLVQSNRHRLQPNKRDT